MAKNNNTSYKAKSTTGVANAVSKSSTASSGKTFSTGVSSRGTIDPNKYSSAEGTILRSSSGSSFNTATGERGINNKYSASEVAKMNAATDMLSTDSLNNFSGQIPLPNKPAPADQMGTLLGANASQTNTTTGVGTDSKGMLTFTAPTPEVEGGNNFQTLLNQYLGAQPEAPSAEKTYNDLYKKSGLDQYNRDIQNYTSQINSIVSKAQADQMAVTGQGRGIPDVIIGGQQAQISKEAAIQALPLQALLANAQGNKELAQTHLDTLYKIKMDDAMAQYNYKTKVLDTVYDYATKQEQNKLEDVRRKEDRAFELKKMAIQQEYDTAVRNITTNNEGTLTGKPQNASQAAANSYANRIAQANVQLTNLGNKFTGKFAIGGSLPNILQSEDRQVYEQAKNNFATAVLRRESGAAIAPSEFETLNKTYFPVAGDSEKVVAEKEALRNLVINNFYNEANVPRPVFPGDKIESNGKIYKVDVDGETLIEQ